MYTCVIFVLPGDKDRKESNADYTRNLAQALDAGCQIELREWVATVDSHDPVVYYNVCVASSFGIVMVAEGQRVQSMEQAKAGIVAEATAIGRRVAFGQFDFVKTVA